jgi:hypothetical protein
MLLLTVDTRVYYMQSEKNGSNFINDMEIFFFIRNKMELSRDTDCRYKIKTRGYEKRKKNGAEVLQGRDKALVIFGHSTGDGAPLLYSFPLLRLSLSPRKLKLRALLLHFQHHPILSPPTANRLLSPLLHPRHESHRQVLLEFS